jgi:hypothetical protein
MSGFVDKADKNERFYVENQKIEKKIISLIKKKLLV